MALGSPAFPSTTTQKGTGPSPVTSVHARIGDVLSANGDYTASQVTNVPSGNIVATDQQAAVNELDTEKVAKAGDSMASGADLTFSTGGEPKGLPAVPGGDDSAVSKLFVNGLLEGLDVKQSCRLASDPNANWTATATADFVTGTGVLTISALTAGAARGLMDAIEPVDGNRILLKDLATLSAVTTDSGAEATPKKYNGLWEVTGGTTTTLTLERTADANIDAEVTSGLFTFIEEGTAIGNGFVIVTPDPIVLNTTAITFSQFSSSGGGVVSFNGRAGAVVPIGSDYATSQITNDSSVPGINSDDALDNLDGRSSFDASASTEGELTTAIAAGKYRILITAAITITSNVTLLTGGDYLFFCMPNGRLHLSSAVFLAAENGQSVTFQSDGDFFAVASAAIKFEYTPSGTTGVFDPNAKTGTKVSWVNIGVKNNTSTASRTLVSNDSIYINNVYLEPGNNTKTGFSASSVTSFIVDKLRINGSSFSCDRALSATSGAAIIANNIVLQGTISTALAIIDTINNAGSIINNLHSETVAMIDYAGTLSNVTVDIPASTGVGIGNIASGSSFSNLELGTGDFVLQGSSSTDIIGSGLRTSGEILDGAANTGCILSNLTLPNQSAFDCSESCITAVSVDGPLNITGDSNRFDIKIGNASENNDLILTTASADNLVDVMIKRTGKVVDNSTSGTNTIRQKAWG